MDNKLVDFALAYTELHEARNGFTPFKEQWYTWNYWAQHTQKEFSFGRWMAEHNLEFEDVSGSKTNYPNVNIIRSKEEGYRYYSAWRGAQKAVEDAEQKFDLLFKEAFSEYSKKELGATIGKSAEELRKFAAKKSWYQPRKTKGTK